MRILRVSGIKLALDESENVLREKAAAALGISPEVIDSCEVVKKAVDARQNKPPHFVYVADLSVSDNCKIPEKITNQIWLKELKNHQRTPDLSPVTAIKAPITVVGCGPAGLLAAYVLVRKKIPVLLFERGAPVEKRAKDVHDFWKKGILDPASNVLFGEGGAGTFSDGKLTSRSKNNYSTWIKKLLVEMGAPRQIITDAKPHIGTDKLKKVLINLRNELIAHGCAIKFEAKVTDFVIQRGQLKAVVINDRDEVKTEQLILAIGQNADDTYWRLFERGVKMEAKPFAMGLRVEHPQELINSIQYGRWKDHQELPPAEYFLTAAIPELKRFVYTFCMCPGGKVIGCSAFSGQVITNGMSDSRRSGKIANSAVVVNVRVEDFALPENPLGGLAFRHKWEKKAFIAGGRDYSAPAQKLIDFLHKKKSVTVGPTSFLPGIKSCLLEEALPGFVAEALKAGIYEFNRKMPGFISSDAQLIGVETRTSSPIRICRRSSDGESDTVNGIYPCGEGSGYSGGIISSALDGIKTAELLVARLTKTTIN